MRSTTEIIKEMQEIGKLRDRYNAIQNEGATDGFNPHEDRLEELGKEYAVARKAESPLTKDLEAEKAWFNTQGFTSPAVANKACLNRGYSLAELQAAAKAAKAAKAK